MRRIPVDRDYIVIRIPKEPLRQWLRLIVIMLLTLVYPVLTFLSRQMAGAGIVLDTFQWWPVTVGYTFIAPAVLLLLIEHFLTGAPPDGRFCVLGVAWNVFNLLGLGACLFLVFKMIPVAAGESPPLFNMDAWPFFADRALFSQFSRLLLVSVLFSTAGLWIYEALFCDMLGSLWGPLYFLHAGVLPTIFNLLRYSQGLTFTFGPDYYRDILRGLFPLAAGAVLCVIAFIIALDRDPPPAKATRSGRYYIGR